VNPGQIIIIGLSLALLLWFAGGTLYNRRRAHQIWRWLDPGLQVLGGRVGDVWIGRSGAGLRVTVGDLPHPLRRIDVIVRLESRENLPLWLYEVVQGKRDQLALRAWLRSQNRGEIEIVSAGSSVARSLQAEPQRSWQQMQVAPGWVLAHRGKVKEAQLEVLCDFVRASSRQLQRYSLRRSEPHLLVQLSSRELMDEPSPQLIHRLKPILAP
jgi:hypothetical protein